MFNLKKPEPRTTPVDQAIEDLVSELTSAEPGTEEEARIADSIKKLSEAKATLLTAEPLNFVSAETLATIGANLAGILLVLNYERMHVLTSKALSSVTRLKI